MTVRQHLTERFQITVTAVPEPTWTKNYTYWCVDMPHQCDACDAWTITAGRVKAEVIAELQRFIDEATEALAQLKEMP